MAPDRQSDEMILNALVDGELDAAAQAAAAARLASDREFARAYATLARLKAAVAECADMSADADIRLPPPRRPRRMAVAAGGIAAALALAIMASLTVPRFLPPDSASRQPAGKNGALVQAGLPAGPVIPDLSPAGLHLARTLTNADAGGEAVVATYVGPRGCRLELRVSSIATAMPEKGAAGRRSWRVGRLVYELVAYGMPAARFEKVAEAAELSTRAPSVPGPIDQRLAEARVVSAPCVG